MSEPAPATPVPATSTAAPLEQGATAAPRLTAVDTFRGLTIMEVVAHHTSGMALRHAEAGSLAHELLLILNRTLHFAVPAFVFLSAVVLTRSLLKKFDLRRYFTRRVTRGAWPYVLWSALYAVWYVVTTQRPPETLTDPEQWAFWLLYGKASFHLYFLLVALEVYLLLPLLLPLARRRPPIGLMLGLGLAVQLGVYFLNREVLTLPFPASTVLWYLLPVLTGVGVGARLDEFPAWWRQRLPLLLGALAVVFALYLPTAVGNLKGESVVPLHYNALNWSYSILVALTLLGAAYAWQRRGPEGGGTLRRAIATLGTVSLPIYLIHPALLQFLEYGVGIPDGGPLALALTATLYFLIALLVPMLIGRLLLGKRLGLFIFGR
ncbi:peptidoglycan/LPS O-acetylase OafA/YrhL [Deinococcus sp. HSC-46F16]|uniref:acyltransferase n=1 Tax=Deinococcus sp. HSC-46F16 TaxID=2910968 RepID=UPI0020A1AD35|nr:acyltransferase [Deinococcus sp. HSC-46F16]MCP2013648.1 peptidoglycan/LPS O-acetylase OafA/YrhL [Deinococcus sp. HSC-46F16]